MPYQHTNRRGDTYYIQAKERAGKLSYSATRKPTGKLVDALPEGYEVYELPENAQVVVRKVKPSNILPSERQLLESTIRRLAKVEHFVVDVEADSLVVYAPDADPEGPMTIFRSMEFGPADWSGPARGPVFSRAKYDKLLRFTLSDAQGRRFRAERWCFSGSIDNWIYLNSSGPLAILAEKYVRHLGKESFFEMR